MNLKKHWGEKNFEIIRGRMIDALARKVYATTRSQLQQMSGKPVDYSDGCVEVQAAIDNLAGRLISDAARAIAKLKKPRRSRK